MRRKGVSSVVRVFFAAASLLAAGSARADRYSFGFGVSDGGGGFLSFGMSGGGGHGRGHHGHYRPCAPLPVVCAPRPVVFAPHPVVVMAPAPVVCAPPVVQTVVVDSGYWVEREQRVWVEGCWIASADAYGRSCRVWQPGRWELRRTREWVRR